VKYDTLKYSLITNLVDLILDEGGEIIFTSTSPLKKTIARKSSEGESIKTEEEIATLSIKLTVSVERKD